MDALAPGAVGHANGPAATNSKDIKEIPTTASRRVLAPAIQSFLHNHPSLHLGGEDDFHAERRNHLEVFGFHALSEQKVHPMGKVEFTAICGPHGTIPIRVFYPKECDAWLEKCGGADLFRRRWGLRLLAESSGVQIYAVEYRQARKFRFPTQLHEYSAVIDALHSDFGSSRGVSSDRIFGGGDSAGGNMTAAISLRRRDEENPNLAGQILYYSEARLPIETPAATENNTGLYLKCNGIFSFASSYLPRGIAPEFKYISPGMQDVDYLKDLPPARVYTSGFDPLRAVGVEYAHKLQKVGNHVQWRHYPDLTHGWLQMTAGSTDAAKAVKESAADLKEMASGGHRVNFMV